MKILDKYVAKNFLIGYVIALAVLVGLRIFIDLFVNIDEFAELTSDMSTVAVLMRIVRFYTLQSAVYFRDFAGIITVVAAAFSLGKMTKNNELIAVMASGVSLKRVITPIIILAILLSGLLVIDQELIIPRYANELIRSHDYTGKERYPVWFLQDGKGTLICATNFEESTGEMTGVTFIIREKGEQLQKKVVGNVQADSAVYDAENAQWILTNGKFLKITKGSEEIDPTKSLQKIDAWASDVTPELIPLKRQESYQQLLSSPQLSALASLDARIKDQAKLYSQRHFRVTEPIINIIMLLVSLPVLVCRDPKAMKPAILVSFGITGMCFLVTFACKIIASEVIFNRVMPELWPWVPVFIFLPIAFLELDSMKT